MDGAEQYVGPMFDPTLSMPEEDSTVPPIETKHAAGEDRCRSVLSIHPWRRRAPASSQPAIRMKPGTQHSRHQQVRKIQHDS